MGEWLRGRIYERRSDISPDGKYLIYFAANFSRGADRQKEPDIWGSWTAISRVPWLKALTLYSMVGCYNGGGLFTGTNTYWLNDSYGYEELRDTSEVKRDTTFTPEAHFGVEYTGVYYPRLLRDDWQLTGHEKRGDWHLVSIFEKALPHRWILRKIAHEQVHSPPGKGYDWDEHALVNTASGEVIKKPDWEWADLDHGTLVWAEKGSLFRADMSETTGISTPQLLRNFTEMTFEPIEAPY